MSTGQRTHSDAGDSGRSGAHIDRSALVVTGVGVAVMMAGTFAPWLASGTSDRNLYSSAGVVQRLAGLPAPVGVAIDLLPLAGLYCVLAAVTYVMGRRRLAAGATALLALVLVTIAAAALLHQRAGAVHLRALGPALTLTGALSICLALGGGAVLRARPRHDRAPIRSTHTPPTISPTMTNNPTMEFR